MTQAESLLALIADLNAQVRTLQADNAALREALAERGDTSTQPV